MRTPSVMASDFLAALSPPRPRPGPDRRGVRPVVAAEDFDVCPVLLTQPAADHWTPLHLSEPFLAWITKAPVTKVMLPNGGHYPLEKEALDPMVTAIAAFIADNAAA